MQPQTPWFSIVVLVFQPCSCSESHGVPFQLPPLMAQNQLYGKEKQKVSSVSNLKVGLLNFRVSSLLLVSSFT